MGVGHLPAEFRELLNSLQRRPAKDIFALWLYQDGHVFVAVILVFDINQFSQIDIIGFEEVPLVGGELRFMGASTQY